MTPATTALVGLTIGCLVTGAGPYAAARGDAEHWRAIVARSGELRLAAEWDAARALVEAALRRAGDADASDARLRFLIELSAIEREVGSYRSARGRQTAAAHLAAAGSLLEGASQESHAAFAEERAWLDYSRAFHGEVTFEDVRRSFHEARVLREEMHDDAGLASAWFGIGLTHQESGQIMEARVAFRRALGLAHRSRSAVTQGYLQRHLGFVEADLAKSAAAAVPYHERSLAMRRKSGHRWGTVFALTTLGRAVAETGDVPRARSLLLKAVAAGAALDLARGVAEAEEALADLEWSVKQAPAACRHLSEASRWWAAFGEPSPAAIETRRDEWRCPPEAARNYR